VEFLITASTMLPMVSFPRAFGAETVDNKATEITRDEWNLLQERVGLLLMPDHAGLTMAGKKADIISKRQDLVLD
jgi:hypothetical protein